jgi:hypothetical protein
MSGKTILAVSAFLALGAAALTPTAASAFGHFGGSGGAHGAHFAGPSTSFARSPSRPMSHSPSFSKPIVRGPTGPRGGYDHHVDNDHHHHDHDHHHHDHDGWWWKQHHRPYWVYPVGTAVETTTDTAAPSYTAAAPVTTAPVARNNCNCLTKTYLQDGSVMFKDLCTKEAAVATPDELNAQRAAATPDDARAQSAGVSTADEQ